MPGWNSGPGGSLPAAYLVAGVADSLDRVSVHEARRGTVGDVPWMAGHTGRGIGIGGLPLGEEFMPVVSPALATFATAAVSLTRDGNLLHRRKTDLDHLLVALQAVSISDGKGKDGRLDGFTGIPQDSIAGSHELSAHPPDNPFAGVAVNAQGGLAVMESS